MKYKIKLVIFVGILVLSLQLPLLAYASQTIPTDESSMVETAMESENDTEADTESETCETLQETVAESEDVLSDEDLPMEINSKGGFLSTGHSAYPIAAYSNSIESQIGQRAKAALDSGEIRVDISDLGLVKSTSTINMLSLTLSEVINSSYRYFYISGCSYTYSKFTLEISALTFQYSENYCLTDDNLDNTKVQTHLAALENALNEALSCVEPEMTDVEKVLAVHDYLVQACDYDLEGLNSNTLSEEAYSTWGVLIDGKAVCQGYAEAFCSLMTKLGIDSYFVGSRLMNHAWNLVFLDGSWYHLDSTWDDPTFSGSTFYRRKNNDFADEGYVSHDYFLKSDAEFNSLSHYGWGNEIPEAESGSAFSGYCFRNVNAMMNYFDTNWYYLSPDSRNKLYKSKIDGSARTEIILNNTADYVHKLGKRLFFSNESGIYTYDLIEGREGIYNAPGNKYAGFIVSEFTIKHQTPIAVLYNPNNGEFRREAVAADDTPTPAPEPAQKKLESISLNRSSLEMDEGTKDVLMVSYNPTDTTDDKTITWKSSAPAVASVSADGVITALSPGTATITAAAAAGKSASCRVTVLRVDPVEAFVRRLYTNTLQREADPQGLSDWVNVLKSGRESGAQVAQGFISSEEFKARQLTDEAYVKILYETFMGRAADEQGLKAWVSVLDSGLSRMHVFKGFAESVEFGSLCGSYGITRGYASLTEPRDQNENVTKFIVRCYRLCLGRDPDVDGLNGWCRQILSGANTAKEAARGFVFSQELLEKGLADEAYVKMLYRVFMDREADANGLTAWVEVLRSGENREHVFNGFADSVEFREICSSYGIK